jgi:hypothetical protein
MEQKTSTFWAGATAIDILPASLCCLGAEFKVAVCSLSVSLLGIADNAPKNPTMPKITKAVTMAFLFITIKF